jgi:molecular chaperone GrpE (heat shock protein)
LARIVKEFKMILKELQTFLKAEDVTRLDTTGG